MNMIRFNTTEFSFVKWSIVIFNNSKSFHINDYLQVVIQIRIKIL